MSRQFSLLNNANIYSLLVEQNLCDFKQENIYCLTSSMYHVGNILSIFATLFRSNITLIIPSYKYDILDILDSIQNYKCNILSGISKAIIDILEHPLKINYDLSKLKNIATGGQLVSTDFVNKLKNEFNIEYLWISFGTTECNRIALNFIDLKNYDTNKYDYSVGKPCPYSEVKIIDPKNGQILPLNTQGELHIRGYNITSSYLNQEELNKKAFDINGW